ncbi:unnamed protein product [Lactuca saligna]|uniref:NAD(P)-binding domain-containing protein n=1 Tax=Lactuca saligna TaxID=75948 RepID=A0AA35Y9X0_LACSI|nr:unnamed protein product [Lactuca saligna]
MELSGASLWLGEPHFILLFTLPLNHLLYHLPLSGFVFYIESDVLGFVFFFLFQENQMTVSITGATGYRGSKLVQRLYEGKILRPQEKIKIRKGVTESQHLLIRYEDKQSDTVGKYLSFVDDDTFPHQRFAHTLPHSIKLLKIANIVGSSFRLFCFHGYNMGTEMVVLWNPSIRKSITVPMPNKFNLDPETNLCFGFPL